MNRPSVGVLRLRLQSVVCVGSTGAVAGKRCAWLAVHFLQKGKKNDNNYNDRNPIWVCSCRKMQVPVAVRMV